MASKSERRVAVVGSGLAGLTTAYLLHHDPKKRSVVTLFEEGTEPALDSASVSIKNSSGGYERIDLPMRSFAGGYYNTLQQLYNQLDIKYEIQPFLFSFSKADPRSSNSHGAQNGAYFIHSSNNHRMPPVKPHHLPLHLYIFETVYLLVMYTYFAFCCHFVRPHSPRAGRLSESLDQYLCRIRMPQYFVTHYILPIISGMATCSHTDLLQSPAYDITEYKRRTSGKHHYTVSEGIGAVQKKLARGIHTKFSAHVTSVEPQENGKVKMEWRHPGDTHHLESLTEEFDIVVLAVPPNVVEGIFKPLQEAMGRIPTIPVKAVVHNDDSTIRETLRSLGKHTGRMQSLILHTSGSQTEAINVQTSGVLITTNPIMPIQTDQVLHTSNFTRVLRTVESQRIVNGLIGVIEEKHSNEARNEKTTPSWRNGDEGVFLCGGWMWDGLVLLEGCAVSAVRVASALGVEAPWKDNE